VYEPLKEWVKLLAESSSGVVNGIYFE
jgi:hypothetical protein